GARDGDRPRRASARCVRHRLAEPGHARCALAIRERELAGLAVEGAALSGDRHGWVLPERQPSATLWQMALKSGDSRVVRYAEKIFAVLANGVAPGSMAPMAPPSRMTIPPPRSFPTMPPPSRGSFPSVPVAAAPTLGAD